MVLSFWQQIKILSGFYFCGEARQRKGGGTMVSALFSDSGDVCFLIWLTIKLWRV